MSVVDLPTPQGSSEGMGRTPPQDVAAEQSVLGGMMLSKDAIADVVEVLRGNDFYRPAHELVFDAVLDLYGRGEPADAVTVSAELTKRGELSRIGGPAYLHTLISSVPTAANAGYYARIVRERAVLRRLVDAGTRIVQLGYGGADGRGGGDVDEIVNSAQAEVYAVTERRTSEDYAPLSEIIEGTIDEIEASGNRGDGMTGVPTGFADLDRLTNGLHPGQMIVIAARPAMGKALALDTPLATPTGWTTMGAVQIGDRLMGADGLPTMVVATTDVMAGRPCYEVSFSDGSVLVADAEHQWLTDTGTWRLPAVRTTEQIVRTLRRESSDGETNHSIRNTHALDLPARDLPVAPYVLGVCLVMNPTDHASLDPGVVMRVEGVYADWSLSNLAASEHIPSVYLRASEAQRRDLLAGLLDTGGSVDEIGSVWMLPTSERLAMDVQELIHSLGYQCSLARSSEGQSIVVSFWTDDDVFQLERKRLIHKERRVRQLQRRDSRFITEVRPIDSVPVRCVEVDNNSHLYLAGQSLIPTHNSTLGLDIGRSAAIHHGMAAVMFSLEMGRNEITMRLLSAEARIPLQNMRKGTMREEDWTRLAKTMGEVSEAPFFIDDSPNMSLMEIRAKCRRLKQKHDLKLVIIDYLQLMTSGKRVESRQQEVSEFSRALKLLAKELQVPVIALSQLNRGPEQRTDKKPAMSDLRESGCLTADTRVLRADTGAEVTMGELFASGEKDVPVWSLDDSLHYVRRHLTHVFSTGRKQVYRVTLASGKQVRATANHPFLTYEGWRPIGELEPGSRVAVPRHVMAPEQLTTWDDRQVIGVAHRLERDSSLGQDLPSEAFSLPKRQIALLLRTFWGGAGNVVLDEDGRGGQIRCSSARRDLLDGVALLMLRFGISSCVRPAENNHQELRFTLSITGTDDQRRFLNEIGIQGHQSRNADRLLAAVREPHASARPVSHEVWTHVRGVLAEGGTTMVKPAPARQRLGKVAELLDDANLEIHAVNDVLWDSVVSVEPDGEEEVFDATVVGNHNFIANGIAVHNSIEQDADMVILLHREDAYEKESPRAGEADFIVAKHRNGPTDTITVAFQGHYSRFVDMAT